jgi:hypothetical protein
MPKTKANLNGNDNSTPDVILQNQQLLGTVTKLKDRITSLEQEIENHERAIESWKRRYEIADGQREILAVQISTLIPTLKNAVLLTRGKQARETVGRAVERIESILRRE